MYPKEIEGADLTNVGDYTVTLKSVGNPDHRQDPDRPLPGVSNGTFKVKTLMDASKACQIFIAANELGSGNWAGGDVTLDGQRVASVSYNGRVWEVPSSQDKG